MEKQIKDHEKRISDLEKEKIRAEERHINTMERLDNLTSAIKWAGGTFVTSVIAVLIYLIQQNIK